MPNPELWRSSARVRGPGPCAKHRCVQHLTPQPLEEMRDVLGGERRRGRGLRRWRGLSWPPLAGNRHNRLVAMTVMVGLLGIGHIIIGMTVKEILAQLKSLGDDARRKHNIKT